MNPKPQPKSKTPQKLKFSPDELAKIQARKDREEAESISPEWRLLSEFGYYYGWQAIRDVMDNEIDIQTFNQLLKGARKIWASKMIDQSVVNFTAHAASQSKKPGDVMKKGMKEFYKEAK